MKLPFDRQRLQQRSALDDRDELAASREDTPAERFLLSLELAELGRELTQAERVDGPVRERRDLSEKSRFYVTPLRLAMGH